MGSRAAVGLRATLTVPASLAVLTLLAGCGGEVDVAPDRLYVTDGLADQVAVLDARTGATLDRIALDPRHGEVDEPHGLALAPDGSHWYATVAHGQPSVWKFDADGDRRVGRVFLDARGAARISLTPDGARAFVAEYWQGGPEASGLTVLRTGNLTVLDRIDLCAAPHDVQVSPDGSALAVTCALGDEVVLLDTATLEVAARVAMGREIGPEPGGARPMNASWTPDGAHLWVTLQAADQVVLVSRDGEIEGRIDVVGAPLQVTSVGSSAVVTLRDASALAIVEMAGMTVAHRIDLPGIEHPHGLAVGPHGDRAFVAFEGTVGEPGGVVAVELPGGEVAWRTGVSGYALGIVYSSRSGSPR